jgi:hypothetical protein
MIKTISGCTVYRYATMQPEERLKLAPKLFGDKHHEIFEE